MYDYVWLCRVMKRYVWLYRVVYGKEGGAAKGKYLVHKGDLSTPLDYVE